MRWRYPALLITALTLAALTAHVAHSCTPIIGNVVQDVNGLGKVNITILPSVTVKENRTYGLTLKVLIRGPPMSASLVRQRPLTMQVPVSTVAARYWSPRQAVR